LGGLRDKLDELTVRVTAEADEPRGQSFGLMRLLKSIKKATKKFQAKQTLGDGGNLLILRFTPLTGHQVWTNEQHANPVTGAWKKAHTLAKQLIRLGCKMSSP
jgi:hypothetical protein